MGQPNTFRPLERQTLPYWWWLIAAALWLSLVIAMVVVLPPSATIVLSLVSGLLTAAGLAAWGRTLIAVGSAGIQVGRSVLEWPYVGELEALDPDQTRRRLGPEAAATAWLATRPWLHEAVVIEVRDSADPHPYWLIGTRDATTLRDAFVAAREAARTGSVANPTDD